MSDLKKEWLKSSFLRFEVVFYPRKVLFPFKMVEGSGRLQMQAPELLQKPVLQRSSSHSKEYTFSDSKRNETATT